MFNGVHSKNAIQLISHSLRYSAMQQWILCIYNFCIKLHPQFHFSIHIQGVHGKEVATMSDGWVNITQTNFPDFTTALTEDSSDLKQ